MDTMPTDPAGGRASTPAQRRRSRQRASTRKAILEATEALLDESASDDFSIRQLSQRCGYTAPTIYNYFADKDALVDALLEERFTRLADEAEQMARDDVDPLVLVRAYTGLFVRFGRENQAFYRLLFARPRRPMAEPSPSVERVRAVMQAPMLALADAKRLSVPLEVAQQSMWVLTHGLTMLLINRPDLVSRPTLVEDALDAMLRGLTTAVPENSR